MLNTKITEVKIMDVFSTVSREQSGFDTQNHRAVEVGRHLWRTSSPTPLLKQDHLELVMQDHVQTGFEYLQGGRLHNLSEQPVLVLSHSHRKKTVSWHSERASCVSVFVHYLFSCH